jgi:ketosteroid isomerase-like protein
MPRDELHPATHGEIRSFVQEWFDLLSDHAPVERLLPFAADDGLRMAFPESTLRSHDDFRDWYDAVGRAYGEQSHEVEHLRTSPCEGGAECAVTVLWRAAQVDGPPVAVRVEQNWRLNRLPEGGWRIAAYEVCRMHELEDERASASWPGRERPVC